MSGIYLPIDAELKTLIDQINAARKVAFDAWIKYEDAKTKAGGVFDMRRKVAKEQNQCWQAYIIAENKITQLEKQISDHVCREYWRMTNP